MAAHVKGTGSYSGGESGRRDTDGFQGIIGGGEEKWLITGVAVIPKSELWLHEPETSASLGRSIRRAETTPPQATDLDALEREFAARK